MVTLDNNHKVIRQKIFMKTKLAKIIQMDVNIQVASKKLFCTCMKKASFGPGQPFSFLSYMETQASIATLLGLCRKLSS